MARERPHVTRSVLESVFLTRPSETAATAHIDVSPVTSLSLMGRGNNRKRRCCFLNDTSAVFSVRDPRQNLHKVNGGPHDLRYCDAQAAQARNRLFIRAIDCACSRNPPKLTEVDVNASCPAGFKDEKPPSGL
jgi:hypothetical protein